MARWKLLTGHYLYTDPDTEIEFKETDRNTGRQARKVYKVPRLLEPKDAADYNYPELGAIIVCDGNNPEPRDIIFRGEPTPDMEPIDAEAKKISKQYTDSGKWTKPEEGMDYGESLIKTFMDRMEKIQANQSPVAVPAIDPQAFADLQAQVKALMERNAKLETQAISRRL